MAQKDRATALAARLRDAVNTQDPVALAAIELLKLNIEELKESLVMAVDSDMLRLQGAARHLQRLHRELTTTPPSIKPTE